jgi:hypothetical protein
MRNFLCIKIVDESNNHGDQSKRNIRRDSFFEDYRIRSSSNPEEQQSTKNNFFPFRKNVINISDISIYLFNFC